MTEHKKIKIIAAIQKSDRGLGFNNNLLYHISDDLKRFRNITRDNIVIMGRKTWESLPDKARPMPGRKNIVITRELDYHAPGATVVHSIETALEVAQKHEGDIFIIGGGEIYKQALPFADQLDLTLIAGNKQADAFFPEYEDIFTEELHLEEHTTDEGLEYSFILLGKKVA